MHSAAERERDRETEREIEREIERDRERIEAEKKGVERKGENGETKKG
jgi:hypothetical protein